MCIANSPGNPQYTPASLTTETMENHILYRAHFEFQPQMKNGIFLHSARCLNCTIVLTNGVLFRNTPHEISKLCACILSMTKSGLRSYCSTATPGVVPISCGFWQNVMTYEYIQSNPLHAIRLTHLTYLPPFPRLEIKTDNNN